MPFKINQLDIFSQKYSFKITKELDEYKTKLGGFLAIICFLLSLVSLVIFSSTYLDETSPRVTISMESTNNFPEINLMDNGFFMSINLYVQGSSLLNKEGMSRVGTFKLIKTRFSSNPENPLELRSTILKEISLKNCKDSQATKLDLDELFKVSNAEIYVNLGLTFCPDFTDDDFWTIKGSGSQLPFEEVHLKFYPCSLDDPNDCASIEELTSITVLISTASLTYNLKDKANPRTTVYVPETLYLKPHSANKEIVNWFFKKIRVVDETQDFSNARVKDEFFGVGKHISSIGMRKNQIHCTPASINDGSCDEYGSVIIMSGPRVETVLRVYPKFFSTISEFGGFSDLIFILAGLAYFVYNNYFYKRYLTKNFLSFKFEKSKEILQFGKYSLKLENIEKSQKKFMEETAGGLDFLKQSEKISTYLDIVMGPEYSEALLLIPFFESIKNSEIHSSQKLTVEEVLKHLIEDNPQDPLKIQIRKRFISIFEGGEKGGTKIESVEAGDNVFSRVKNTPMRGKKLGLILEKKRVVSKSSLRNNF